MKKRKLFLTILAIAIMLTVFACSPEIKPSGVEGSATDRNVTILIKTDKEVYNAGENIHLTITVKNDRKLWTLPKTDLTFENTKGVKKADGSTLSCTVPELKAGESYDWECDLTYDMTGTSASKMHDFFIDRIGFGGLKTYAANDADINAKAYVSLSYGGQDIRLRAQITSTMRLDGQKLGKYAEAFSTICCHDPSIFRDLDGTYYIIGSFLAGGTSKDLSNWTSLDSTIQGNFTKEVKEQIRAWNDDANAGAWNDYLWAPDVIYNTSMNKYCLYLSANGDNWVSNIVMLTADSVLGPYDYAGTIVYSGFTQDTMADTDVARVLGTDVLPDKYTKFGVKNKNWGKEFPNVIDPCVFYDEEGKLWMSYGSWSGGIYVLELDEQTGLRDYNVKYETNNHSDAYFGTKIAGGKYVSGEASYIEHIGDYYYLFVSYGNLEANGGYNIRVFRSERPDGDYVDALGNSPLYDVYKQNYNQSVGIRLFGAYRWRNFDVGQVSQGHNSALLDADGRAYFVFHTRTTDGSEGHYVKVHQLFVNKEGWLVAAPYRYGGETFTPGSYKKDALLGDWEIILHKLDVDYKNKVTNKPESITLCEDGSVTGAYTGTWSFDEATSYLNIAFNDVNYSGVALSMKIEYTNLETMVFTCLGNENQITLWGSKSVEQN